VSGETAGQQPDRLVASVHVGQDVRPDLVVQQRGGARRGDPQPGRYQQFAVGDHDAPDVVPDRDVGREVGVDGAVVIELALGEQRELLRVDAGAVGVCCEVL
jgi:hypothetical protein